MILIFGKGCARTKYALPLIRYSDIRVRLWACGSLDCTDASRILMHMQPLLLTSAVQRVNLEVLSLRSPFAAWQLSGNTVDYRLSFREGFLSRGLPF